MRPGGNGRLGRGGRGRVPVGRREKHGPVVAAVHSPGSWPGCARSNRCIVVHAGTTNEGSGGPGTGISACPVAARSRAAGCRGRPCVRGAGPIGRRRVRPSGRYPSAITGLCRPERAAHQVGSRSVSRPGGVRLTGRKLTISAHERWVAGLVARQPVTVRRMVASVTVPNAVGVRHAVTGGARGAVPGRATGRRGTGAPPETVVRRHTRRRHTRRRQGGRW